MPEYDMDGNVLADAPAEVKVVKVVNIGGVREELSPENLAELLAKLAAAEAAGAEVVEAAKPLSTPDVTPAQARAFGVALIGFLAVAGFDMSAQVEQAVLAASVALPAVWVIADAIIRFGRAKYLAATRG